MDDIIKKMQNRVDANPHAIKDRWERGIPHHPLSQLFVRAMAHIDWKCFNLVFDISVGGDGDNGESLMYLLDAYFEEFDGVKDVKEWLEREHDAFMRMLVD